MNPNLRIFFKQSAYALVFAILMAVMLYSIPNVIGLDLATIGSYFMYGLMGLMMIAMGMLITGVIFRAVWTGIMNRTDTIVMCCPDKTQGGVHLVCSHYNPGGESTEGFSSYFHYYLDQNGKLYLSKKVEKEGDDIQNSLAHLSEQTRLQLDPDRTKAKRIGSYNDEENKGNEVTFPLSNGELHFRGYEGLIDYGFKISFRAGSQTRWRVTI